MYLGLDLSTTNSGLVLLQDYDIKFKLFSPSEKDIYKRSLIIIQEIKVYTKLYIPYIKHICIESPAYMAKGKVAELAMLTGAIYYYFKENNKQVSLIPPSKLKKFLSGNGRASKNEMINSIPQNLLNRFREKYKKVDDLMICNYCIFMAKE
jgi:Holliday junction resolvasome RuvABC endonuclease subunit